MPRGLIPKRFLRAARCSLRKLTADKFVRSLNDSVHPQRDWLMERITLCRRTRFGLDHGFREMLTVDEFRRRIIPGSCDVFDPAIPPGDAARLLRRLDMSAASRLQLETTAFCFANAPESYDVACADAEFLRPPCGTGIARVYSDRRF